MKKLLILLLTSLTIQLTAQTASKEKEKSNAEIFSAKSGTLMQKEFIDLDKINNCEVQVLHFTDLITGIKQSGLKFSKDVSSSYSRDSKSAMLDADEIIGLMKSIKLIQDKILITNPDTYTEVSYRSRSGFESGCFKSREGWSCYLKLEKYDEDSYVLLSPYELNILYGILEQAKLKM